MMNDVQIAYALSAWCAGHDTAFIAAMIGVPESVVANHLPKLLEQKRLRKGAA